MQAYQRSNDALDDAVATGLGVNRTDLRCLDWLSGGPMTVGRLAKAIGLSSAAATTMVDRLTERGLVTRRPDPDDGRRILVEVTPEFEALAGSIYGPLVLAGNELVADIPSDRLEAICQFLEGSRVLTDRHRALIATMGIET